jgi:hypothetical protein
MSELDETAGGKAVVMLVDWAAGGLFGLQPENAVATSSNARQRVKFIAVSLVAQFAKICQIISRIRAARQRRPTIF